MANSRFSEPVQIKFRNGPAMVQNVREAAQMLFDVRWPKGGPKYREAVQTCLQLLDRKHGHASDGKAAFIEAAEEAGILIKGGEVEPPGGVK